MNSVTGRAIGWAIVTLLIMHGGASAQMDFSPSTIQKAYDRVTPAICIVRYSANITNPNSSQMRTREVRALGLLVSKDGLVMTHGHMVTDNAEPSNVRVVVGEGKDEKVYDATVLEKPDDINLVFVRIQSDEPVDFPYIRMTGEPTLKLGEEVLLFGLLAENLDFARAVQTRRIAAILDEPRITYCLDRAVPFGYLTGPVLNHRGEWAGVIGYDLSPDEGGELYVRSGHPLVFQTALFEEYIDNPPGESDVAANEPEAWLGVYTQPLTEDLATYWGLDRTGGIVVATVVAGSPAERAGFLRGDIIIEFDGTPIRAKLDRDVFSFTRLVREKGVGQTVPVVVLRDGKEQTINLTLESRPKSARDATEYEDEVFGLTVREITTDIRIRLNLDEDVQGVIVSRVKSGSSAQLAGVRPGVIILSFAGRTITGVGDFENAVGEVAQDKPSEVTVFCRVGAQTGFIRIEPHWE